MTAAQVLVVGAGPTGLTLACDLARRGVAVRIIDQAPGPFPGSRAKGLTPRTVEVFDDLGIAEEATRASTPVVMRHHGRDGTFIDQRPDSYWRTSPAEPHPQLLLPQWRTEAILRSSLSRLGVTVEYGTRLAGFEQDGHQVVATVQHPAGSRTITAGYLVGCDGGHSTVRRELGVAFEGTTHPDQALLIGDLEVTGLRADRLHFWADPERGFLQLCPFAGSPVWQVAAMTPGWQARPPEPSREVFQRAAREITGSPGIEFGAARWTSTYRVNVRVAERLPIAAWTLGTSSERLRDLVAEIGKGAGADLGVVNTDDTRQLGLGYRWSPLSHAGTGHGGRLRAGDRAPDAPCRDAGGASVRLFDLYRGPHFTLLG
ncbi:FAD-dependent monooxygenase [Nonomuraea angiospora]|uniref:FAD-dependent monooxygenase n=1 Tax=Nonomuraea angiospora TaxID=46172 RepID=UPI00341B8A11